MIGYIYKTTNLINGLIYVGKHEWPVFDKYYIGSGKYLKEAIKEFGRENFKTEFITTAETIAELRKKEEYWVNKLNSKDPAVGYNIVKGGNFGSLNYAKVIKNDDLTSIKIIKKEELKSYLDLGWKKVDKSILSRIWKKANKDKIKEQSKRYYSKHKEKRVEYTKKYSIKHRDKINNYRKEYRLKHKDKINKQKREYYSKYKNTKEWQNYITKHREKINKKRREYYQKYKK